jgi:hypothetical protein
MRVPSRIAGEHDYRCTVLLFGVFDLSKPARPPLIIYVPSRMFRAFECLILYYYKRFFGGTFQIRCRSDDEDESCPSVLDMLTSFRL